MPHDDTTPCMRCAGTGNQYGDDTGFTQCIRCGGTGVEPDDPHGDIHREAPDPTVPIKTRVAETCACGTVLRINIIAGPTDTRKAIDRFRDRHTGPGHGPAELIIDRRRI